MDTLDRWIIPSMFEKENQGQETDQRLPTGAVSVYFKEGEGFTIRYDSLTYNSRMEDLIMNLSVLSNIWNRLIQLNLSPRYISKAYDDDIYAIVIDINNREGEMEIEIDGLKVKVSKHRIGAKILDLSRSEPEIQHDVIRELEKRRIYFENPMLQYQLALDKIKGEDAIQVKPTPTTDPIYSNEYIKSVVESDPWIYDPRFQRIWYRSEFSYAYEHDDWHTNSGHFNYIAPNWKKNGGDSEELSHIILANRDKHLRQLLQYFEEELKQYLKNLREFAESRDIEYTKRWKQHSLDCWRTINMIREELKLSLMPIPEILNLPPREIILKTSSRKTSEETDIEEKMVCEMCGAETDELHQLRTGQSIEYFPDKKVCWSCYLKEHKKVYEEHGRCPECYTKIYLDEWPNFKCENGHIINVNFIELNPEKILDDAYGKLPPNDYKKLHNTLSR